MQPTTLQIAPSPHPCQSTLRKLPHTPSPSLVVIGAAAVDIVSRPDRHAVQTTTPGTISITPGGVARNVFEAAFYLGVSEALLISPIGAKQDTLGMTLKQGLQMMGADTRGLVEVDGQTPVVNILLDEQGQLLTGVADTDLVERMTGLQVMKSVVVVAFALLTYDCRY